MSRQVMSTRLSKLATGALSLALLLVACSFIRDLDELEPGTASSSGSSGTSGTSGDSGPACPPEMVEQRFEDGVQFCIDRTEVTQAAYATFLAQDAGPPPEGCQGNTSLRPDDPSGDTGENARCAAAFDPDANAPLPVVCVDHCDATTYCRWRGARLCGGKDGANLDPKAVNQVSVDEWFVACSNAKRRFASGDDVDDCVFDSGLPEPAASPRCATPENVLHLSGNVTEWTAACQAGDAGVRCLARGGNFHDINADDLRCAHQAGGVRTRTSRAFTIGFRCCKGI